MRRVVQWLFGDDWGIRSVDGVAPPDSPENRENILRFALPAMIAFFGVTAVVLLILAVRDAPHNGVNEPWTLGLMAAGAATIIPGLWYVARRGPLWTAHLLAVGINVFVLSGTFAIGVRIGPYTTLAWIALSTVNAIIMERRVANVHIVLMGVSMAVVVGFQRGNNEPVERWLLVMSLIVVLSRMVETLVERGRQLTQTVLAAQAAEHEALTELESLNRNLAGRVEEQVEELGRLGQLRRFLSAPVANALLSDGGEALLDPHRCQIAVFHCDLRGFTGFASGADPEDVVDVVDDYYKVVGEVLRRHGATVGMFAGDGIMAYLNDPVPCEDAAAKAVAMAIDLGPPMAELCDRWRSHGQRLAHGVGIAYGYATLGMVGFEERNDYAALGSVVNLAARLCAEADDGDILLDQRTLVAIGDEVPVERVEVTPKGFDGPVSAFRVLPD